LQVGVRRIEDRHHPRGYRELRSPAEMRKLVNRKIVEQDRICAICHSEFRDYNDVVPDHSTHDSTCVASSPQVLQVEPVIWEEGEIRQLPTFPGDPDGGANAINDKGQAVGFSGTCSGGPTQALHGLLWQGGMLTDLGNLGGTASSGQDINNQGQVVGIATLPDNTTVHAFLWTEDHGMQDLGTLPGDVTSFGYGINEQVKVVGSSIDASDNFRAFLWQRGVMTDLNSLIPAGSPLFLLDAFDINSRGPDRGRRSADKYRRSSRLFGDPNKWRAGQRERHACRTRRG